MLDDQDSLKKFDEFLDDVAKEDEFAATQLGLFTQK